MLDLRGYGLEALPENIGDLTYLTKLNLNGNRLTSLPESIGNLTNLTELYLNGHKLTNLPESIGNLTNLTRLDLNGGSLSSLPDAIANLINLKVLKLSNNQFDHIPEILFHIPKFKEIHLRDNPLNDISNLKHVPALNITRCYLHSEFKISRKPGTIRVDIGDKYLDLIFSRLDSFINIVISHYGSRCIYADKDAVHLVVQENIDRFLSYLSKLPKLANFSWEAEIYPPFLNSSEEPINRWGSRLDEIIIRLYSWLNSCDLYISGRHLKYLPESLSKIESLKSIRFGFNLLQDLSILNQLPNLSSVNFLNADLPRRYWTKLSEWKPEWLLDENNTEIRRRIIDRVGYEKICEVLNATKIDTWREYVLLKIDDFQPVFEQQTWPQKPVGKEPIVLLKMTCPSTGHIHILRIPPEMTSAEDAIVWVNHGIHPDRFTVQT
ncbi:leucine-rich repeat domain-containing protein [Chamaesiphon sp. VAR_48_metabat_135_sub]|uniref:leucine-rich repeat domain-containing protein n=1 Tax=Chamaesiphon sp. VAR_48_metabat_135_sub TaxID=2964699 RepID=UPI00286B7116|nr:leucine-rich repeat domain-containing protein [Chamaesiphon sp. VAR_48_metabat_135_sub]